MTEEQFQQRLGEIVDEFCTDAVMIRAKCKQKVETLKAQARDSDISEEAWAALHSVWLEVDELIGDVQ